MSECTHDCSTCSQSCGNRIEPESLLAKPHELSHIKKVIGVCSGKGGVGKSLVTSMLAVLAQRQGLKVGILDADITGPSIPKAFGIKEKAMGTDAGILPVKTKTGIDKIIKSFNTILASLGVEEIVINPGDAFDEGVAEAIMNVPAGEGEQPNTVNRVLKKGYRQGDKVIRFAQVIVTN